MSGIIRAASSDHLTKGRGQLSLDCKSRIRCLSGAIYSQNKLCYNGYIMTDTNHLPNKKDTKFKPGWGGGPGRPPKIKTQVKDFIKEHPYAVETLMTTLYEMGIKGDRDAAMYIIDRIKGKPKATIGIDEADRDLLTAATVIEFRKLIDRERLQLKEGEYGIQGHTEAEGSQQDSQSETQG